ncbi:MAG: response regulator [Cyanothece sp. SIO1E1]|nr:response regulator [Cyanothece sp. SIO1E1]
MNSFDAIQICRETNRSYKSGCLLVDSAHVSWRIYISQGQLQYATHSLQSIDTLMYHLTHLGYRLPATAIESLRANLQISSDPTLAMIEQPLYQAITQLQHQHILTADAAKATKLAISKDALQHLLWLTKANHRWSNHDAEQVIELAPMAEILNHLQARLQSWQQLWPVITSPHQQPWCPDHAKLTQPVRHGALNPSLLSTLVQLMQGNSIHQLSLVLKQDSLKLAQLLHPYIQQQVFLLRPPSSPFDKSPNIRASLAPQSLPQHIFIPKSAQQSFSKTHKIVCIDDSQAMLETIQRYLGSEGFDVVTVENPMESISTLFSMKPDLILMDVSMPGINGNRLCEILRRSSVFKQLPIIMVSGNTSILDKAKAESSGATDYLTKPFSKADLIAIIETHLAAVVAV